MPEEPISPKKRLSRYKRAETPPPMRFEERDIRLLDDIAAYRFLTQKQVQWLFVGEMKKTRIADRLSKLYHNGYLERLRLEPSREVSRLVHTLTERGARKLAELTGRDRSGVPWQRHHVRDISSGHIYHYIAINDMLIALSLALTAAQEEGTVTNYDIIRAEPKQDSLSVYDFDKDGSRVALSVTPDIALVIQFTHCIPQLYLLEVDRGTVDAGKFGRKVKIYSDYLFGQRRITSSYHEVGFVVLTVCPSEQRLQALVRQALSFKGERGFWFTTMDAVSPQTVLEPIWRRASVFRGDANQTSRLLDAVFFRD